jgi:hypothetical protein
MMLRIYALSLAAVYDDLDQAVREFESFCAERYEDDPHVRIEYHVFLRMAPAYYDRDTAVLRIQDAVDFFAPETEDTPPKRIDEYFRSLTNLSSNRCALGEVTQAVVEAQKAVNIAADYTNIGLRQPEYAWSNLYFSRYCAGYDSAAQAAQKLASLCSAHKPIDPLVGYNVSAMALAAGRLSDAEFWSNLLFETIREYEFDEAFIKYLTTALDVYLDFHLRRTVADKARQRWMSEVVPAAREIPYRSGYNFERRDKAMENAFNVVNPGDTAAWANFLFENPSAIKGFLPAYYKHGFMCIVIEYWIHS